MCQLIQLPLLHLQVSADVLEQDGLGEVYLGAGILAKAELQIFLCIRKMGCDGDTNIDSHSPIGLKVRLNQNGRSSALASGASFGGSGVFFFAFAPFLEACFGLADCSSLGPAFTKAMLSALMLTCTWLTPCLSVHWDVEIVPSTRISLPLVR